MNAATIEGAIAIAEAIVTAIVKLAPAIQAGVASSTPYVEAIAGMIKGSNATQEEIDALMAQVTATHNQFQQPLPPDDGSTST